MGTSEQEPVEGQERQAGAEELEEMRLRFSMELRARMVRASMEQAREDAEPS